tara:strand:- start:22700 stop:23029 length:330 start_codon:yes stop_codon:yes gene_type:complete
MAAASQTLPAAAPDALKGAAIAAVCVAAPGVPPEAALVDFLKDAAGTAISKPRQPREIHFVEALPKTRTMKTMRRIVRAELLGEYPGNRSSVRNPETIASTKTLQGTRT